MSTAAILLIFFGLFLVGGAISFWRQKMPLGVVIVLAVMAAISLASGLMRL
ncbi:hypothetical protein [Allostreptomyces psammosilenae]|uniref:Putative integral membrane protein n=1 Tax=Allostreptomyces psammosilenae TaxID=1892865 RepID=A0A853A9Q6_9ACTN|nr:hypothetical protein [Allostreptomyces psammosilenae]NYI07132.1 putative integral membrane protein [Allostreptomyces psammosilenae]